MRFTCWVNTATAAMARPARRPAALQLVGIESLFRLVVPCWTPRGTHPDDRPTAPSRLNNTGTYFPLTTAAAASGSRSLSSSIPMGVRVVWRRSTEGSQRARRIAGCCRSRVFLLCSKHRRIARQPIERTYPVQSSPALIEFDLNLPAPRPTQGPPAGPTVQRAVQHADQPAGTPRDSHHWRLARPLHGR